MTSKHDDLRLGETAIDLSEPVDAALRFIGRVRTPFKTRELCPRRGDPDGPECALEFLETWEPALQGIEAFETIEVLYWLHQSRRDLLLQSPRSDGRTFGTFALRSPVRPNPIGTSVVRLLRREGAVLIVRGMDCLDGTPLLDIKPDRCVFATRAPQKAADTA
jgi:tRNA-Thr(GGU) m(6)t(6)A37 methyltransferase TsaA